MITAEQLMAKARELAAASPDFIYEPGREAVNEEFNCKYMPDEIQPGCLFGQALTALGVELIPEFEGVGVSDLLRRVQGHPEPVSSQPKVWDWLDTAQARQDGGEPWGMAIQAADEHFSMGEAS